MADVGCQSAGLSFGQCPLARLERGPAVADSDKAANSGRAAGCRDLRPAPRLRGISGLDHGIEKHPGPGFFSGRGSVVYKLRGCPAGALALAGGGRICGGGFKQDGGGPAAAGFAGAGLVAARAAGIGGCPAHFGVFCAGAGAGPARRLVSTASGTGYSFGAPGQFPLAPGRGGLGRLLLSIQGRSAPELGFHLPKMVD